MNSSKSIKEKGQGIFNVMEENWIKMNRYALFSNWLIPRNYNHSFEIN